MVDTGVSNRVSRAGGQWGNEWAGARDAVMGVALIRAARSRPGTRHDLRLLGTKRAIIYAQVCL